MPARLPSVVLQLRLDERVHARYAAEAAAARKPLATYLRERLEREDALEDRLAAIDHALAALAVRAGPKQGAPAGNTGSEQAAILEMLLILRQLAGGKADFAQKELKRRKIEPWS
jgi:hypothetical protein